MSRFTGSFWDQKKKIWVFINWKFKEIEIDNWLLILKELFSHYIVHKLVKSTGSQTQFPKILIQKSGGKSRILPSQTSTTWLVLMLRFQESPSKARYWSLQVIILCVTPKPLLPTLSPSIKHSLGRGRKSTSRKHCLGG